MVRRKKAEINKNKVKREGKIDGAKALTFNTTLHIQE